VPQSYLSFFLENNHMANDNQACERPAAEANKRLIAKACERLAAESPQHEERNA